MLLEVISKSGILKNDGAKRKLLAVLEAVVPEDMAETAEIARITGDYEFFRKASGSQKIMQSIIWKRQIQISRKNTGLFLFESAGGFRLMWEPVSPFEPLSGKSG